MVEHSFLSRVRRHLPDLHPAERKLGELVCDFPGELASYSASELAELAGVSNATVSRFVRRLGYQSYDEARRDARQERISGSRLYLGHAATPAPEEPSAYAETDMQNVRQTLAMIEPDQIDALAEAALSARKVWVVGFRAGHPLASYLHWQLLQVVEQITAIPGGGQTMGEHLAGMGRNDLVLMFGLRRRIASLDGILDAVGRTGARLAYITDEGVPRHEGGEWHFRCMTQSSGPLFSHVGVMALLNLIANRTIALADTTGRKRLSRIESFNDLLNEL